MGLALDKLTESEREGIAQTLFKVTSMNAARGELHGLCPIHSEKNPSFGYNVQKDRFHCFGCGISGDLVKLWMSVKGYSDIRQGFMAFVDEFRIDITQEYRPRLPGPKKSGQALAWHPAKEKLPEGVDRALRREKAETFVAWAHEKLIKNEAQLSYLAGRGIGKETAIKYKLGYNPGQGRLHAYFRPRPSWGLPPGKRLIIPGGIVIPYLRNNEVLRIRIRRSVQNSSSEFFQRYYVVPGSIMTPMIIGSEMKAFVVVETELDALMLHQEVRDLVGVLAVGSAMAKPGPDAYQALKKSVCILNALDFDKAGYKAWKWWQTQFHQVERWPVPAGNDPGEAFESGVDLREWVLTGLPPVFQILKGRIGPSSLLSEKGKGAQGLIEAPRMGKSSNETLMASAPKDALRELYGYLKKYPIKIRATETRLSLIEKPGYSSWETGQRISQLVFYNDEVLDYLHRHPDDIVSCENFWDMNRAG